MEQDLIVYNNLHEVTNVLRTRVQKLFFTRRSRSFSVNKSSALDDIEVHKRLKLHHTEIRRDILEHVNDKINDMVSEILETVETSKPTKFVDKDDEKCRDKIKSSQDILPSKHFVERNSLLTDILKLKHLRPVYNIFVVILIIMFTNVMIRDIMVTGYPKLGLSTMRRGFGKFSVVLHTWLLMKASTFGVYVGLYFWAQKRFEYLPKRHLRKAWDYGCLAAFLLYQISFTVLPTKTVVDEQLPVASSVIVLMEQVRMLMKTHAFVRSTSPRFLSYKPHTEETMPKVPGFSQFLYFMFAPTLVYQDNYPRTRTIRWKVATFHFAEVLLIIFFITFVFESFVLPVFQESGNEPLEWLPLLLIILKSMMPGLFFFLCGFYCLLHAWMNGCAEVLRFADRMFYKDWWNASSHSTYFKKWNVVVHDWLYTYVYKDIYEILTPQNKFLSAFTVFMISSIVHEYIMAFAFRFFFPIMFIHFGFIGHSLYFVPSDSGNTLMWLSFFIGNGTMLSFYAMEYFARVNCPTYHDGVLDLLIPRSWMCLFNTAS